MAIAIGIEREKIEWFCRRWHISELSLFGSILSDNFRPGSDVDVLVSFQPDAQHSLFDLARMQEELKSIFGREVDLIERRSVERSENYIRRKHILEHLEPIYVS